MVGSKENDQTLADIDSRLEELQTQLLKLVSSKADYEDVPRRSTIYVGRAG